MKKFTIIFFSLILIQQTNSSEFNLADLKYFDPFLKKKSSVSLQLEKVDASAIKHFYLDEETKIFQNGKVRKLKARAKVRVLYDPKVELLNVVDKSGSVMFQVRSKNLIDAAKAEDISESFIYRDEKISKSSQKENSSKLLVRTSYGGGFLEDSFNPQFLNLSDKKIYAGILDLEIEGFIQTYNELLIGLGLYLTTGQYMNLEQSLAFQNLSFGPSLKYNISHDLFIGIGGSYSMSHDITVGTNQNLRNILYEIFLSFEILSKSNLENWGVGLKLKSINHTLQGSNEFQARRPSISVGAYVSKGFNFFNN